MPTPERLPWIVNLELTNACNLECVFCDHKKLKKQMRIREMDLDLLDRILDEIAAAFPGAMLYELGLVGLGEPTLAKNLAAMLRHIGQSPLCIERLSINSNLVPLNEKTASVLLESDINAYTFSLNASNPAAYESLMGKDEFATAVANLKTFLRLRKEHGKAVDVAVQVMDCEGSSLEELAEVLKGADTEGVNFFVRSLYAKPILKDAPGELHVHAATAPRRYPCFDLYSRAYFDVEGNLYPCTIGNDCYREGSGLCLGNIREASLPALYNSERISEARERELGGEPGFPECRECNIWSLTPNNFMWNGESSRWELKEQQIRAYGLKEK